MVCNSSPFKQRFDITIIEQMDKTGTFVAKNILIGRLMTGFWQCNCLLADSRGIRRSRDFLGLNSANQQDSISRENGIGPIHDIHISQKRLLDAISYNVSHREVCPLYPPKLVENRSIP